MKAASKNNYDVVVIGGGINGLVHAVSLAQKGKKVMLCERRAQLGGVAASREIGRGCRTSGLLCDASQFSHRVIEALSLQRHGLALEAHDSGTFVPLGEGGGFRFIWIWPRRSARFADFPSMRHKIIRKPCHLLSACAPSY